MASSDLPVRRSGRVLVMDAAGRVLLLQGFDPARPDEHFWFTVGGGLDDGEGAADGAARELTEEVGISAAGTDLTGPVWQRDTEFSFDGTSYRQHEEYYVLRVGEVVVSLAGLDEVERETVTAYRWWGADELATTSEHFFPPELPDLLVRLRQAADLAPA